MNPYLMLFEEFIGIKAPYFYLDHLPGRKQTKLLANADRQRECIGLKHSIIAVKVFLLFLHIEEFSSYTGIPKEIWSDLIVMTLEVQLLDRIAMCEKMGICYSQEVADNTICYYCFDITKYERLPAEEDSYLFQREEYHFRYGKRKISIESYFFSENWIQYGIIVEEFINSYKCYRREKYSVFCWRVIITLLVLYLAPVLFWQDLYGVPIGIYNFLCTLLVILIEVGREIIKSC